jgi:hypothetical protein
MANRKKNGGREVGTPNKLTKVHREYVQSLLDNQTEKIKKELNSLKGKEYLSVILSLMDFAIPKLSKTEMFSKIEKKELRPLFGDKDELLEI